MAAVAAVSVDDNLAAGQPRIAHRTADHEASGGIDVMFHAGWVIEAFRHDRANHMLHQILLNLLIGHLRAMLVDTTMVSTRNGLPSLYSTVTWDFPSGRTHFRIFFFRTSARRFREPMRQHDRHGHELRRFVGRITEHKPLVSCAAGIHSHGDIAGLLVDGEVRTEQVLESKPHEASYSRHP